MQIGPNSGGKDRDLAARSGGHLFRTAQCSDRWEAAALTADRVHPITLHTEY